MIQFEPVRVVLDTNVLFEGMTKKGGACGYIIDFWRKGLIQVFVSDALAYEYVDVLSRKFSADRWAKAKPVLATLLQKAKFVAIHYSWRPASPDPGDDLVIGCAMNAGAGVVTSNVRDFRRAQQELGLTIMRPIEFLELVIA